ncbi:hypothetical protein SAMN05444008_13015 [Cnuella takakiae]|uniref:Uncharacterized protein n=1 Tax=Cnuella takakiae TaxID=1302690 RepID=A0A1M5JBI4_9BACT|nr:hypothetical protein [Cnuella takakiae]OLY95612.1 hypothetical protein BUE76_00490 [Cnuella takakiae]SHG37944.1 hypothetical protein SAMN05444008_13015 [Cnuella takakiae]
MSATKNKLDPNKLVLPGKKEISKPATNSQPQLVETAVQKIHEQPENGAGDSKPKKQEEVTRRTTLDIPESLHKAIKRRLIDNGQTIKDYFLDLAKKDLGL